VELVHWTDSGPLQRGVVARDGMFAWEDRPIADPALRVRAEALDLVPPYLSEINLAADALIASLGDRLQRGLVLMIDYGFSAREYYHPQRHMGTLRAHYRHHALDDTRVEGIARDADARVSERLRAQHAASAREAHDGEVAGAAAEISDQHDFGFIQLYLKILRRCDRLRTKRYLSKPGNLGRSLQPLLSQLVVMGIERKLGRSAQHDLIDISAEIRVRSLAHQS
jgi:hypothetical protein